MAADPIIRIHLGWFQLKALTPSLLMVVSACSEKPFTDALSQPSRSNIWAPAWYSSEFVRSIGSA